MQRLVRVFVFVALIAVPAIAVAATDQPWVTSTCGRAAFKPKAIHPFCGDDNNYLDRLSWQSWSSTQALGKGVDELNNCTPTCVAGKFKSYRVTVKLSDPKTCRGVTHKLFRRLQLTYSGRPPGGAPTRVSLTCPSH